MNPVEIEQALTDFAQEKYDPIEFPFKFLSCFGNKETTIKKLKSGATNNSDIDHGLLQRNNIHMATCANGSISQTLKKLKDSEATVKGKAQLILATDGKELEAENLVTGETIASSYEEFPDHFGFLLPLAGIQTTKEIETIYRYQSNGSS